MSKSYICGCSSSLRSKPICQCYLTPPLVAQAHPKQNTYLPNGYYPLKDKGAAQEGWLKYKSWRLND